MEIRGTRHKLSATAKLIAPLEQSTEHRQIIALTVDLVQTSCGFGVPLFAYKRERDALDRWAEAKGLDGLKAYQREKNVTSMDGLPTGLFDDEQV